MITPAVIEALTDLEEYARERTLQPDGFARAPSVIARFTDYGRTISYGTGVAN
jgi:hypothetical protein